MTLSFRYLCISLSISCACFAETPFEILRQYPTSSGSSSVFPADVDNDGDIDIVVSNRNTNDVSVLYNDGNGIFPTKLDFPAGQHPRSVHGADFDGDGDVDLCTSDFLGYTETVLENDGNGNFTISGQYYFGANNPFSWVDDIDGDGHVDILVTHWDADSDNPLYSPAQFTPLLNNGDGTFVVGPSVYIGKQPRSGASADLNGDGIKDIATADFGAGSISIIIGLGKRKWADAFTIPIPANGHPRYLTLGDFDLDGAVDIAAVDKGNNTFWIAHNDGKANFTLVQTSETNPIPHSIDTGDVDLDGDLDLIVSHVGATNSLVLINDGAGLFPGRQIVHMTGGPADVRFTDVNNDGELDIVSANINHEERGLSVIMQGNCEGDDCNFNGIGDICELPDCNFNGIPDECEVDCDGNGIPDSCDIASDIYADLNNNGILDECECLVDVNVDGVLDVNDILAIIINWGSTNAPLCDLNQNGVVEVNDLIQLLNAWGSCD